jgi:DNA-binding MarR family transcriptional regulator
VKNLAKYSSRINRKSLTLTVLEMIRNGLIAADIARALDVSKAAVSYHINKGKKMGYIEEVSRDAFKVLELTQAGKNFLDQYEKNRKYPWFLCRAENIQFKAEIVQMPTIPVDWERIQMNHWPQYKSHTDGVKLKLNMGKKPTLYFLPSPLEGNDPFDLFVKLVFECVNVIMELHEKLGLRVGPLQLCSRGEWLVYDPAARVFCRVNGQVTYEGVAKVNASKPRCIGEFEFFDPRALLAYLSMPSLVERIDKRTERIESRVEILVQNSEFKKVPGQIIFFPSFTTIFFSAFEPLFIF